MRGKWPSPLNAASAREKPRDKICKIQWEISELARANAIESLTNLKIRF